MRAVRAAQPDADELIDLIYAAMLGEAPWQRFIDRLSDVLPDGKTTMFFHDVVRNDGGFALTSGLDEGDVDRYNRHYARVNPWMAGAAVRPVGVGVVADQMLHRRELVTTQFHAEYLRSIGSESAVGITVEREEGRLFLLSTLTSRADPGLNVDGARLLTRLSPHLRRAFRHQRGRGAGSAGGSEDGEIFDALGIGLVVVGDNLRIKSQTALGARLLTEDRGLGVTPDGRLSLADENALSALNLMLAGIETTGRVRTMTLRSRGRTTRIALVRMVKDNIAAYFEGPTVLVLIDPRTDATVPLDAAAAASAYRLSAAERRVLDGIVAGMSPADIATAHGISRETVRSQIKMIFQKTGVNRQAELLRLVIDHDRRRA